MSEFLFLYRNGEKLSPEQMQQQMGRWMTWLKELGDKGVLSPPGTPSNGAASSSAAPNER